MYNYDAQNEKQKFLHLTSYFTIFVSKNNK